MRTILIVIIIFLVCQLVICLYAKERYNVQQVTGHFGVFQVKQILIPVKL